MSDSFAPYHVWLGIPPSEQPPNHYRLLALAMFEDTPEVIENAADRQMAHVRRAASGRHAQRSQEILNEISKARRCLLSPTDKQEYDAVLRAGEGATEGKLPPQPPAPPAAKMPAQQYAATTEWIPSAPPKRAAPKRAPQRPAPLSATDLEDGQKWKGAPQRSPSEDDSQPAIHVATPTGVTSRMRKRNAAPILFVIIPVVAVLPVLALLYALASVSNDAESEDPDGQPDIAAVNGDRDTTSVNTTNVNDAPPSEPRLPTTATINRDNEAPSLPTVVSRDPLDDTPSLGADADGSTNSASVQTLTVSAKTAMIQLALFKLPPHAATGVMLNAGQKVTMQIEGQYRIGGAAEHLRGPSGLLIAVGSTNGPATQHFKGREELQFTVRKSGQLFLAVDDLIPVDNQGELTVTLSVED